MKAKQWIAACGAALVFGMLADSTLAFPIDSTSQVVQVDASLSGVVLTNGFAAYKDILTSADIINLARGRAMTNAVPTNEVLSLVIPCGEDVPTSLVVFDKVSSNNLVTVADIDAQDVVEYKVSYVGRTQSSGRPRADAVLKANFGVTGDTTNGWTSGILAFPVLVRLENSGSCLVQSISAKTAVGNLKGISAGTTNAIVITTGKIITNGQSWTIVASPP